MFEVSENVSDIRSVFTYIIGYIIGYIGYIHSQFDFFVVPDISDDLSVSDFVVVDFSWGSWTLTFLDFLHKLNFFEKNSIVFMSLCFSSVEIQLCLSFTRFTKMKIISFGLTVSSFQSLTIYIKSHMALSFGNIKTLNRKNSDTIKPHDSSIDRPVVLVRWSSFLASSKP